MEPGSLVLDETATTLTESKAKSSACGLAVVRDIYYLKLLAIEVVCQLALDTVSERPKDSPLFSQLVEQIQEEIDHLNQCRIFLSQRDALETSPPTYDVIAGSCALVPAAATGPFLWRSLFFFALPSRKVRWNRSRRPRYRTGR